MRRGGGRRVVCCSLVVGGVDERGDSLGWVALGAGGFGDRVVVALGWLEWEVRRWWGWWGLRLMLLRGLKESVMGGQRGCPGSFYQAAPWLFSL